MVSDHGPTELLERARAAESRTVVVLGSGMSTLFDEEEFGEGSVELGAGLTAGHPMRLGVIDRGSDAIVVMIGRRHGYEGENPDRRYHWYDTLLGIDPDLVLLLSAAGGLSPLLQTGDLLLHTGYLQAMGGAAVSGAGRGERIGPLLPRFENRGLRYDEALAQEYLAHAAGQGIRLSAGTYAFVPGPSYETRAEVRMLRRLGADVVGMSTLPEVARATEQGIPVLAASLVTNRLSDTAIAHLDHSEVTQASRDHSGRLRAFVDVVLTPSAESGT